MRKTPQVSPSDFSTPIEGRGASTLAGRPLTTTRANVTVTQPTTRPPAPTTTRAVQAPAATTRAAAVTQPTTRGASSTVSGGDSAGKFNTDHQKSG